MGCASSKEGAADATEAEQRVARDQAQPSRFAAKYRLGPKLGSGGFGIVKLATTSSGEEFAVKIMTLPKPGEKPANDGATHQEILNEVQVLAKLRHANCLYMKEWYAEDGKAFIVMEVVRGCEVLEAMSTKGQYNEADARVVIQQTIQGMAYVHSMGIVHRDLKLENLMLSVPGDITTGLKIIDFGLARMNGPFDEDDVCGTPMYVAPEVLGAPGPGGSRGVKAVTVAVDMWAIGVVMYMLLAGYPPFMAEPDSKLFSLIRRGRFAFPDSAFKNVSESGKDLISRLLEVNADVRLTADESTKHPWFGHMFKDALALEEAQKGLKKILARRRFKGAIDGVVAIARMRAILRGARAQYIEGADEEGASVRGGAEEAAPAATAGK